MVSKDGNGWNEYEKLVLADLCRIQNSVDKVELRCTAMEIELGGLRAVTKDRARVWGAQGGTLGAVILGVIAYVVNLLIKQG